MLNRAFTLTSLALLTAILSNCTGESESRKNDYSHTLVKRDSLKIDLDFRTTFEFQNIHYYEDDSVELLAQVNLNINGLNLYDVSSGNLVRQFEIPKVGPGATPSVSGISFVNLDSILVYQKMSLAAVNIFNAKGDFVSRIRPTRVLRERENSKVPAINHQSSTYTPAVLKDNRIYFSRWALFNFSLARNISDQYPVEFYLDLETLETHKLPVYFPTWMQNSGWNMLYLLHGKTVDKRGNFVYSFQGDDSVTVMTPEGTQKRFYAGHSESQQSNKEPYIGSEPIEQEIRDVMTNTLYWGILYDKYRDVFYRISDVPVKYLDRHRSLLDSYEKPVSVVILNSNFKKIGEVNLTEDTYVFYGAFVGKKGLYIPRLNPKYYNFSEDHVTYSVYELIDQ